MQESLLVNEDHGINVQDLTTLLNHLYIPYGAQALNYYLDPSHYQSFIGPDEHAWVDEEEENYFSFSSSIGTSVNKTWFNAFDQAVYRNCNAVRNRKPTGFTENELMEASRPGPGIVFPSSDYSDSVSELEFSRTITMFEDEKAEELLRDGYLYKLAHPSYLSPLRDGKFQHNKVIVREFCKRSNDEDPSPVRNEAYGWVYCGSHNFSPSAWGRISKSSVFMYNYELGLLFVTPKINSERVMKSRKVELNRTPHNAVQANPLTRKDFYSQYPVPFEVPPVKYRTKSKNERGFCRVDRPLSNAAIYTRIRELESRNVVSKLSHFSNAFSEAFESYKAKQKETESVHEIFSGQGHRLGSQSDGTDSGAGTKWNPVVLD